MFGEPLLAIKKYAMRSCFTNNYDEELPIIVYSCAERINNAGKYL